MDNQSTDCGELHDTDDGDKNPSSPPNADDRTNPVCMTESLGLDQPHTTQDQEEAVELKVDVKSLCRTGDAAKSLDQVDVSLLRSPTARYDPASQFSNASIVSGSENRNTHRKTGADMRILGTYMRSLNEMRPPEEIPPSELDKYLSSFFLVVRKTDGSEYEPCSLRAMLASIERYLRQKNYPASLTRDNEFSNMRNVLKLKQQMLRSLGKGQKTVAEISQSASIREGRITQLFQSHEMGPYSPNSVLFSLCFFLCMYLKLRKSTEHKKLLWGDIILCEDYNNREYLTFSPQMLSRIHASQRLNHRLANARIWAEPEVPERDPVALYKLYAEKRPPTMNQSYAPFYLGLNLISPLPGHSWYRPAALGINKLNEMVRQIRDLTGLKSSNDSSTLPYILPTYSQDTLPIVSELSNAGSDPSSSRDGHNVDSSDFDGREATPNSSPRLTIDFDETYAEPVGASASIDQPLSLVRESDSSDEQSLKSPCNVKQEEKDVDSPSVSAVAGAADGGDSFQHQVATMNAARVRELLTQSSEAEEPAVISDEDEGDFIGIEQAKELVSDIIQRMDIMDMVQFDRWLKNMTIARDTFSGQVVCKDPSRGSSSTNKYSTFSDVNNEHISNETTCMNVLLNIALTPSALRGQGPVTVQAHTVSAADLHNMSTGPTSHTGTFNSDNRNKHSYWNGTASDSDSPLDLALSSLRNTSGSAAGSHHASRVSSATAGSKHSTSSSLAGAAGECSPAKQKKPASDSAFHQSTWARSPSSQSGASVVTGVRRSAGQYEGSRRKLNPAFLTHIKPRNTSMGAESNQGRVGVPVATELEENVTLAHSSVVDDEDLVHVLNLKQEIE